MAKAKTTPKKKPAPKPGAIKKAGTAKKPPAKGAKGKTGKGK